MGDFKVFVIAHWPLWLAFVLILIALIVEEVRGGSTGASQLSPGHVVDLINQESAVVLDIRNKQAYNAGHIIDAINIPVDDLEKDLRKINKHKSKKLIIVCQTGADAHKAVKVLKINGFKQLFSLKGGVKLWEEANLPLEHKGK